MSEEKGWQWEQRAAPFASVRKMAATFASHACTPFVPASATAGAVVRRVVKDGTRSSVNEVGASATGGAGRRACCGGVGSLETVDAVVH